MPKKSAKPFRPAKRGARRRRLKTFIFIAFTALVLTAVAVLSAIDHRILPPVLEVMDKTAKNHINISIDQSLQAVTSQNSLSASDFYTISTDEQGMVNALSVNTVLVNSLCAQLAVEISARLDAMGNQRVYIPFAAIFQWRAFANLGPGFPVSVMPIGNAIVDYETIFESVGINQVNFQLWLTVESTVRVVNPMQNTEVNVMRKIALVNTIFSGQVPDTYLHNIAPLVPLVPSGR